jgi:hypothetical protein
VPSQYQACHLRIWWQPVDLAASSVRIKVLHKICFLISSTAQSWHGSSVLRTKVQDMTEIRISLAIPVFRSMQKPPYVVLDSEADKTVKRSKALSF